MGTSGGRSRHRHSYAGTYAGRYAGRLFVLATAVGICVTGCGGSDDAADTASDGPPRPAVTVTATEPTAGADGDNTDTPTDESSVSLPPGAETGLDDYDGNGEPDPTCGTQDFGAGLVLRIPCEIISANEPMYETRLVPDSLFRLPGATDVNLDGISGSLVLARDAGGVKVVIFVFNTDGLFATGSDVIGSTDTLDGSIRLINSTFPDAAIQVRGHTDATGTAAGNQTLSERRAAAVEQYLVDQAVSAASTESVGLGSTQPLTEEAHPDGSADSDGQAFNRRVELVLRLPS